MLIQHSVNSDCPINTLSSVLQAIRYIPEIGKKATLNINMT